MNKKTKEILEGLAPLFEKADKEGLWFNSSYQDLWFSPNELRKKHKEGSFLWGVVNWTLRDPKEKLEGILEEIEDLNKKYREFEARIKNEITSNK